MRQMRRRVCALQSPTLKNGIVRVCVKEHAPCALKADKGTLHHAS